VGIATLFLPEVTPISLGQDSVHLLIVAHVPLLQQRRIFSSRSYLKEILFLIRNNPRHAKSKEKKRGIFGFPAEFG